MSVIRVVPLLAVLVLAAAAWGQQVTALFPGDLFTYTSPLPNKRIGPTLFEQVGREVEAMQAALGTNLSHVVTGGEKCFYIESPAPRRFPTLWRAPTNLVITEVYCEIEDGTSVEIDVEIDDGDPWGIIGAPLTCTTTPTELAAAALGGDTEAVRRDRFDVVIGTVTGSVTSVSICVHWEPAA